MWRRKKAREKNVKKVRERKKTVERKSKREK
jgi:hypothetical protein